MKLFLASDGIPKEHEQELIDLVGKKPTDIRVVFIPTAANPYPAKQTEYMNRAKRIFGHWGAQVDFLNLEDYPDQPKELEEKLSSHDIIWVAGGNCYFLRYWTKKSGFDEILPRLLEKGIVYAGESAASINMGPSLKHYHKPDEPENGSELIDKGLGYIDYVIIPHFNRPESQHYYKDVEEKLQADGFKTKRLNDNEVVITND